MWDEVNRTLSPKIGVTVKAPLKGDIDIYNPITGMTVRFTEDYLGWTNIQNPLLTAANQIAPIKLLI